MIYEPNKEIPVLPATSLCVVAIQDNTTITASIDGQTVTLASFQKKGSYVIPIPSVNKIKADKPVSVTQGTFNLGSSMSGGGGGDGGAYVDALRYKGSVPSVADLPQGAEVGDMYNIEKDGNNYAWTGTEWDSLGPMLVVRDSTKLEGKDPISTGWAYQFEGEFVNRISPLERAHETVLPTVVERLASVVEWKRTWGESFVDMHNRMPSVVNDMTSVVERQAALEGKTNDTIPSCVDYANNYAWRSPDIISSVETMLFWRRDVEDLEINHEISTGGFDGVFRAMVVSCVDHGIYRDKLLYNSDWLLDWENSMVDMYNNIAEYRNTHLFKYTFRDTLKTKRDFGKLPANTDIDYIAEDIMSFVDACFVSTHPVETREIWFETGEPASAVSWPECLIWTSGAAPQLEDNTAYRFIIRLEHNPARPDGDARLVASLAYSYVNVNTSSPL